MDAPFSVCKSLGEVLKEHRTRCSMTQEFVAGAMGGAGGAGINRRSNADADCICQAKD